MSPPIVGIGHSLGAVTTYMAAATYPRLFSAIILIDPPIFPRRMLWLIAVMKWLGLAGTVMAENLSRLGAGIEHDGRSFRVTRPLKAGSGGGSTDLFDLERIEVLRGPQGTLFGKNVVGGAISMHTRRPSREFEGKVGATVGDYDLWALQAMVNGPLGDTMAGKLVLQLWPGIGSDVGFYALLGMGAMMGASLQAPLAALTAMMELTHSPGIVMPGMLVIVVASLTASELFGKQSLFITMLRANGLDVAASPVSQALRRVTVRFAGDSGDGMQLARTQFTASSALFGNDLATLPNFPAEIRAPAGSLPGAGSNASGLPRFSRNLSAVCAKSA